MKVTMIRCDNPSCNKHGEPELLKPLRPPYAWLHLKGGVHGPGPYFEVTVCSLDCLEQAVQNKLDEDRNWE